MMGTAKKTRKVHLNCGACNHNFTEQVGVNKGYDALMAMEENGDWSKCPNCKDDLEVSIDWTRTPN